MGRGSNAEQWGSGDEGAITAGARTGRRVASGGGRKVGWAVSDSRDMRKERAYQICLVTCRRARR